VPRLGLPSRMGFTAETAMFEADNISVGGSSPLRKPVSKAELDVGLAAVPEASRGYRGLVVTPRIPPRGLVHLRPKVQVGSTQPVRTT
jgi:hypothetical protein